MSNKPLLKVNLVSIGSIIPHLHYGPNLQHWWTSHGEKNLENGVQLYPIRLGWQTVLETNNKFFYTQVQEGNEKNENCPGYMCHVGTKFSDVEETPTPAVTSLYQRIFPNSNTKYSGPQVLGWDNPDFLEQSLTGIEFRPFLIKIDKYNIYITALGCPDETGNFGAGIGYTALFVGEYLKKSATYVQRMDIDGCHIELYQDDELKQKYVGTTPNDVWIVSKKFKKFQGTQLFGLEHSLTKKILAENKIPKCNAGFWDNINIMNHLYNYHLRRQTISNIEWHQFFIKWKENPSTIIEFYSSLKDLYPLEYVFKERELRAWRAMLKAAGCHDITPFGKDESKVKLFKKEIK